MSTVRGMQCLFNEGMRLTPIIFISIKDILKILKTFQFLDNITDFCQHWLTKKEIKSSYILQLR